MEIIKNIFQKLIQTPLIGDFEKNSIINSFNNCTNESDMFVICKQIEYNYCTDEFLKTVYN